MRAMFGPFGLDPFAVTPHIQPHRAPRRQVAALWRFSRSLSIKLETTLTLYNPFQAGPLAPFGMMGMVSDCVASLFISLL